MRFALLLLAVFVFGVAVTLGFFIARHRDEFLDIDIPESDD